MTVLEFRVKMAQTGWASAEALEEWLNTIPDADWPAIAESQSFKKVKTRKEFVDELIGFGAFPPRGTVG